MWMRYVVNAFIMDRLIESDDDDGSRNSVDNCAQITWHAFARVWLVCRYYRFRSRRIDVFACVWRVVTFLPWILSGKWKFLGEEKAYYITFNVSDNVPLLVRLVRQYNQLEIFENIPSLRELGILFQYRCKVVNIMANWRNFSR